jgi:putative heme iron utilization protein
MESIHWIFVGVQQVQHYLSLPVTAARIVDLDKLGLNLEIEFDGQSMRARLPFPRPAESRGDIKTVIVECTRAAAAAGR